MELIFGQSSMYEPEPDADSRSGTPPLPLPSTDVVVGLKLLLLSELEGTVNEPEDECDLTSSTSLPELGLEPVDEPPGTSPECEAESDTTLGPLLEADVVGFELPDPLATSPEWEAEPDTTLASLPELEGTGLELTWDPHGTADPESVEASLSTAEPVDLDPFALDPLPTEESTGLAPPSEALLSTPEPAEAEPLTGASVLVE